MARGLDRSKSMARENNPATRPPVERLGETLAEPTSLPFRESAARLKETWKRCGTYVAARNNSFGDFNGHCSA